MNRGFVFPFPINPPHAIKLVLITPPNNGHLAPVQVLSYSSVALKFSPQPADWLDVGVVRVLFDPPDSGGSFFKTCDSSQQTLGFR
jgi:hypothetical protein